MLLLDVYIAKLKQDRQGARITYSPNVLSEAECLIIKTLRVIYFAGLFGTLCLDICLICLFGVFLIGAGCKRATRSCDWWQIGVWGVTADCIGSYTVQAIDCSRYACRMSFRRRAVDRPHFRNSLGISEIGRPNRQAKSGCQSLEDTSSHGYFSA